MNIIMHKQSLIEEIERINQINEYNYDYNDIPRYSKYNGPQISHNNVTDINKIKKNQKLSPEEKEERNKKSHQSHLLDINNQKDKMVIFAHLSKNHNIKNATPETLKIIEPLKLQKYMNGITLYPDNELELEYGYYLLRFNIYGVEINGTTASFFGLHLSPTFNSILNNEEKGFKRQVAPSFEDFKNFMLKNKNTFRKEIITFFENRNK
jgi:hypothetical protein